MHFNHSKKYSDMMEKLYKAFAVTKVSLSFNIVDLSAVVWNKDTCNFKKMQMSYYMCLLIFFPCYS